MRSNSFWFTFVFHKTTVAGGAAVAGGAGGALRAGASLVTVDVLTGHICSVSLVFMCRQGETSTFGLCKAADVQRSGPGPRKRAHEAAQRQTQFLDHVLCPGNNITSRRWRASSPSRSSPTPASLVKTRSRHTSLCRFSFGVSAIQNVSMYVLGMRQQRTSKSMDRRPVSFVFLFLCYALRYKTSQNCSRTKRVWSLALSEDLFSEPEERKKSRAGRGSVCNLARQSH